jgi:hypothetical protein
MSIRGTNLFGLLAAAALTVAALPSSASAASLGGAANATSAIGDAGVVNVHSRGYRHCHWRNGRERCHGGYARYRYRDYGYYGYYPYYRRPGFGLYLNFGGRRHNRWR